MIRELTKQLRSSFRRRRQTPGRWPVSAESTFVASKGGLVVHGLHKSATMFLYRFFDEVCSQLDIPLYSIHKEPPFQRPNADSFNNAFVVCPVRSFSMEADSNPRMDSAHHLFQVRDPRDVLVSEYYSIGWRHTVEGWSEEELARRELIRTLSVEEYVLREPEIAKYPLVDRYMPLVDRLVREQHLETTTVVKYETMVTDFPSWLQQVLPQLNIELSPANEAFLKFVADRYHNEFKADNNDSGHRRNVTPGDHRNKLSTETIEALNERFGVILQTLGY